MRQALGGRDPGRGLVVGLASLTRSKNSSAFIAARRQSSANSAWIFFIRLRYAEVEAVLNTMTLAVYAPVVVSQLDEKPKAAMTRPLLLRGLRSSARHP